MAFNLTNISGVGNNISDSLLNDASKELKSQNRKTEYIKFEDLDPSELNKDLSKNGIEELAEQIYHDGLDQPLVVTQKKDGRYEVLGGGRRLLAIKLLIDSGRYDESNLVECKIKYLDESNLPLTDTDKRIFTWLTTNQYREKTDSDKYIEALRWKDIITKLRKKKINILVSGYDEEGNAIENNLEGKKTRQIIAEQTNMSESQVSKIETIDINGTDKLREALKNDKINIATATTVSKMDAAEQDEFLDEVLSDPEHTSITSKDIDKYKSKKAEEKEVSVPSERISTDLDSIAQLIEGVNELTLTEKQFESYKKHIHGLIKLLNK